MNQQNQKQNDPVHSIKDLSKTSSSLQIDEKPQKPQPANETDSPKSTIKPITSPKTSPETGIFNKISSIWTNRNENTTSDNSQNKKKQPDDIVKSFKKFFKS